MNTVLWNTTELIFPREIEARKDSEGTIRNRSIQPYPLSRGTTSRKNEATPLENENDSSKGI